MTFAQPREDQPQMTRTIKFLDDFYPYPELYREIALRSEFYEPEHYAGHRSRKGFVAADTLDRIKAAFGFEEIALHNVRHRSGHFYVSPERGRYRTSFFSHHDLAYEPGRPAFSLVIYLTPEAPRDAGTGLYSHRETGVWRHPTAGEARALGTSREALLRRLLDDGGDRRAWIEVSRVDNVYNRAVLFPAHWYHSSLRDFGGRPERAKLYQAFFFHGTPDPFAT